MLNFSVHVIKSRSPRRSHRSTQGLTTMNSTWGLRKSRHGSQWSPRETWVQSLCEPQGIQVKDLSWEDLFIKIQVILVDLWRSLESLRGSFLVIKSSQVIAKDVFLKHLKFSAPFINLHIFDKRWLNQFKFCKGNNWIIQTITKSYHISRLMNLTASSKSKYFRRSRRVITSVVWWIWPPALNLSLKVLKLKTG